MLKLQYVHGILIGGNKGQVNIELQRTNTLNAIIHMHYAQRKAVSITPHEQTARRYQTINTYKLILVSKNRPWHTHTCMISHTQVCTDELVHT